jgi:hypothetical protein
MKRSLFWLLAVGMMSSTFVHRAAAAPSAIATSMGDLRWGLSESEVAAYVQRHLGEQYNAEIAKTKDGGKQSKLRSELKRAQSDAAKSLVQFDGAKSRWDNSPIAGEFTYGNGESLIASKGPEGDNYYFFVNGRLWKWVELVDKSAAGGDFKKFSASVEGKFGKGRVKKGELTPGQGNTQWLEYLDRNSRMRAADQTGKRSTFALVYEEMATVRELASSRPTKPSRAGGASDDDESEVKSSGPKSGPAAKQDDGQLAKAPSKKSMFAAEHQNETENDYQSRKQKAANDARDKALKAHERKEEAKKGEALKQLDGLSDSDPLGGL